MSDPALLAVCDVRRRVFPLRLSPIELVMLADDQPGYSMSFFIRLQLSGQIERGAFEASLDAALDRHPLLRARIKTGKAGWSYWILAPGEMPDGDWGSDETRVACSHDEGIDLTREIGLRVWVREGAQRASVLFQFHHACCDGTGAYRFIGDVLAGYGIRTTSGPQCPVFGRVEEKLLRLRKQHTLGAAALPGRGLIRLAISECWRIIARQPNPLAAPVAPRRRLEEDFPGFLSFSFDRADQQQLRDAAVRSGVTLNDLLLRDVFLILVDWNRRHRSFRQGRWLRIMMPTDLRSGDDYEMPAANLTGYTFLARTVQDCTSPEALLQSIRNETALIKHRRAGSAFMDMIFLVTQVRWLLPFFLSRNRCLATAVLSNAADPSRRFTAQFLRESGQIVCGNLLLEEITGVPPLRRKTRATFSISQYNRRLTVSLRCDPQLFSMQDTASLLALYIARLQQSARICPKELAVGTAPSLSRVNDKQWAEADKLGK